MKTFLASSDETGDALSSCGAKSVERTIAEEVRVFRAAISQWAASYVARQDVVKSADASANLRNWSRDYFRAMKDTTEVQGAHP